MSYGRTYHENHTARSSPPAWSRSPATCGLEPKLLVRHLRYVTPHTGAPMLPRYLLSTTLLLSVRPLAEAQQPAPRPSPSGDYSRQPFVFEQIREVAHYDDDGRGTLPLAARVRIQSEAGLQAFGELTLPYSAANQRLDVDTVRVHK